LRELNYGNTTILHTDIHKLTHTHKHKYTYVHLHKHIHTHTYKVTYIHTHTQIHIRTYKVTYIHIHTYIHTYVRTYIHTYTIYTDNEMALYSLNSNTNHTFLIEEIRKKLAEMGTTNLRIQFCWVKPHVCIHGNELADTLAKEAATNALFRFCSYNTILSSSYMCCYIL
jgi:hypothetical protein